MSRTDSPLGRLRPPLIPDFSICDAAYGEELLIADCQAAFNQFRHQYPLYSYSSDDFPLRASAGACYLTVEVAGPTIPLVVPITGGSGYTVADAVAWISGQCLLANNGIGGFVTTGISRLSGYIWNSPADYWNTPFPATTFFTTVTLSGPPGEKKPGDYDPSIPTVISNRFKVWLRERGANQMDSDLYSQRQRMANMWEIQSIRMTRGGSSVPWYTFDLSATDEMTYECDADLGSPLEVDCAQIEWNQLYPTKDTVTVTPTSATFFHHNTCYLALSALTTITLTWNQIRTAMAALMNMCVQNPMKAPQGGRAFASPPHRISAKRRDTLSNGLNALPPSVNLTVFQQTEPWSSPTLELESCAWRAVVGGSSVTGCK
ncbi:hypothetical protein MMC14_003216 [Varicellaria rhodocarpa]|nr:hypothetical protein [Varicellaria rhodocarpa]